MRFFDYIILKEKDIDKKCEKAYKKGYNDGVKQGLNKFYKNDGKKFLNELFRLREDHWDKMAFDKLILDISYDTEKCKSIDELKEK